MKPQLTLYKYQVAEKLGISRSTLRRWMNVLYYEELHKIGYRKSQKILTPKIIAWINNTLVMD